MTSGAATIKTCSKCGKAKAVDDFYIHKTRPDGRQDCCIECKKAYNREHYLKNRDSYLVRARLRTRHGRHRLTNAQWDSLRERAGGACEICRVGPPEVIDHDHSCHKHSGCQECVRGILCRNCNSLLGHAKDDPERLRLAIAYLGIPRPFVGPSQ